jgi:precorrin-2 dehydrogenase/sirohydrochlorin ferrochelatase
MKRETASYYPIFLNIKDRRCIVIGGGQVALRKVKTLLEYGATVVVISPELCTELAKLAKSREIHAIRRHYKTGDLEEAIVAIAATDSSEINQEVAREARSRGILTNVVDVPETSDFILPSYLRRGDVTIAISTSGRSPALARKIRTRLEKEFGDEYASLALLIDEVRTEIKVNGLNVNGDGWQKALDLDSMIDLLKKDDIEKARALLLDNLRRLQK